MSANSCLIILTEVRDIKFKENVGTAISQKDAVSGKSLIAIFGSNGFIMCGLLDMNAADKLGMVAAKVSGVNSIDELLEKKVVAITNNAEKLGVSLGISGLEALEIMHR